MDRGKSTMALPGSKLVEQKLEEVQELLPGIPDEITISKIAPKLPWSIFPILASVSGSWQRAIWSRQVYDARVLSKSVQTVVAWIHCPSNDVKKRSIVLHSIADDSYDRLPSIPGVNKGIPESCGCVSLDGKLYILGGSSDGKRKRGHVPARVDVYVSDVSGVKQWKECAKMEEAREQFGCATMDGKIYVFGGRSDGRPVNGSEVYDPKADSWSRITTVPSLRFLHKVAVMGEELVLHGGEVQASESPEENLNPMNDFDRPSPRIQKAVHAEVYHVLKNEWRILEHFTGNQGLADKVVMVGKKFLKLNPAGLQLYNVHTNSWEPSRDLWERTYSIQKPGYIFKAVPLVLAVVALENEVLALVLWNKNYHYDEVTHGPFLIKSQGVGGKIEEVTWQVVSCPFMSTNMCPIQL